MRIREASWTVVAALVVLLSAGIAAADDPVLEGRIRRQDQLVQQKDWAKLLEEAKTGVQKSDTAVNRYLLGRAYGLLGEFEKAREQFDWAMERDPASPYPYHGLGVYFTMKRNFEEAEKLLKNALELAPRYTRARRDLAKLYLTGQDVRSAEDQLRKLLEIDGYDLESRTLLAHLLFREKRFDDAIREFRVIVSKRPNDFGAQKGIALSYTFQKKAKDAIREFKRVIRLNPKDLESYVFLKNLQLNEGDEKGAIETLTKMVAAAKPGSGEAKEAQAELERIKKGGGVQKKLSLEDLLDELASADLVKAREAMRVLVQLQIGPRPPRMMLEAVIHKDKAIRVLAVRNLGNLGGTDALGLLEIKLLHERDRDTAEEVRGEVIVSLGKTGSRAAVPLFLAALDDPSLYVFRLAVRELRNSTGRYFVEEPGDPVLAEQRSELTAKWREWYRTGRAYSVKLGAIEAFRELKVRRFSVYLPDLLMDPEKEIAGEARTAFYELTGVPLGTVKDLDTPEGRDRLRKQAIQTILKMASRSVRRDKPKPPEDK